MSSYSDTWQCAVLYLSQWRVNSYELLGDAILGTNLYLIQEYLATYVRWLCVDINTITAFIPPSTSTWSCTVTIIPIIIIIWSRELHAIMVDKPISTYSSKPSNSQWILFTGNSYTKLIVVIVGPDLVAILIIHSHLPFSIFC